MAGSLFHEERDSHCLSRMLRSKREVAVLYRQRTVTDQLFEAATPSLRDICHRKHYCRKGKGYRPILQGAEHVPTPICH